MAGLMKHLRIVPSSPSTTPRGLDMWFRVFESQTILYKCIELLRILSKAIDTLPHYHRVIIAANDEHDPIEEEAN
jgi:hypothetical protein